MSSRKVSQSYDATVAAARTLRDQAAFEVELRYLRPLSPGIYLHAGPRALGPTVVPLPEHLGEGRVRVAGAADVLGAGAELRPQDPLGDHLAGRWP